MEGILSSLRKHQVLQLVVVIIAWKGNNMKSWCHSSLVLWSYILLKNFFLGGHLTSLWFVLVILFLPGEVTSVTIPTNGRWITLLIETFLYYRKHCRRKQMQEHTHAPPFPKSEVCGPNCKTLFNWIICFQPFQRKTFGSLIHLCVNWFVNYYKYSVIFFPIYTWYW